MKKVLFSVLLAAISIGYISAQNETKNPIGFSHWSVGIKAGGSYFRTGPSPLHRIAWKNGVLDMTSVAGGTVEYTINHLVGFGIEGSYIGYTRDNKIVNGKKNKLIGSTIDGTFYGSVNLANLLVPYRIGDWKKLNVYGNAGIGFGIFRHYTYAYNYYFYYPDGKRKYNNTVYGISPVATMSLNAEYNLTKAISLELDGQYRYYDKANLGGIPTTNGHCDALTVAIGLRYKFDASATKQHVRNAIVERPKSVESAVYRNTQNIELLQIQNDSLNNQLKNLEKNLKSTNDSKNEILNLKTRLDKVEKDVRAIPVQKNNSGVDPNLLNKFQKLEDDLKALSEKKNGVVDVAFDNIEFLSGSTKLNKSSYSSLNRIVSILKGNSTNWSSFIVSGHTDNIGDAKANRILSQGRAVSVKNYLVSKGIAAEKITVVGYGADKPIDDNNTAAGRQANRRVEFAISK